MTRTATTPILTPAPRRPALLDRAARRAVHARLGALRVGSLHLVEGRTTTRFGNPDGTAIIVRIDDPRFYRAVVTGGDLGAADAWIPRLVDHR